MTDNATRWERVCPIQRNEFATDFHPVAATWSVSCYWRLQRNGLLVAVALGRPTVIMVQCRPVSGTFKRRWVLLLSLMCAVETEDDCFRYMCAVSGLVSKHFFSIPIPIPSTRCQYRSHPNMFRILQISAKAVMFQTVSTNRQTNNPHSCLPVW